MTGRPMVGLIGKYMEVSWRYVAPVFLAVLTVVALQQFAVGRWADQISCLKYYIAPKTCCGGCVCDKSDGETGGVSLDCGEYGTLSWFQGIGVFLSFVPGIAVSHQYLFEAIGHYPTLQFLPSRCTPSSSSFLASLTSSLLRLATSRLSRTSLCYDPI